MSCKKRNLVCLLLLFVAVSLWAREPLVSMDQVSGYEISSYHFSIKGKTKEFALRNAIIPDGPEPQYTTLENFEQALEAKKQILDNKRIFSKVSFTYEFTSFSKGIAYYDVYFTVVDSFTLLPIPYAKYDNDAIGLRIGMKIYNKNLFGTFADLYMVGHVSQGNGGLDGWNNRQDYLEMTVNSLPLGSSLLDFSFTYKRTLNDETNGKVSFDINLSNLKLFGIPFSLNPSGVLYPSSDFTFWNPSYYKLISNLGPFLQSDTLYSLENTTKYTYETDVLYTKTYIRQYGLSFFGHPLDFNISVESNSYLETKTLGSLNIGPTLGSRFSLPFGFSVYPSEGMFLRFVPEENPLKYSYVFKTSLDKSNINWDRNFRTGSSISIDYTYDYYPQEEYRDKTYWLVEGKICWFPIATKHFNPSLRITGFASNAKYDFLPSDTAEILADYFRGILQSNTLLAADDDTYVAVMNLNLTMTFITLKNFASTYISPFLDIGVLNDPDEVDTPLLLATAGADGYVILDKFPSFPLRGSFGVNLRDAKKAIDGVISARDVEFEISVGMGFFF